MHAIVSNPLFAPILITLVIIAAFPLVAGYIVLVERKLLLKEDIIPADSDKALFWFAPCISTFTALTAFSVLPFAKNIAVADVNVGLLVVSSMSAVGILGIILGGWSSNSHYSLLGALRSAAQLVSYEV